MAENKKIGIIGSGSWATALVKIFQNNVDEIMWYVRKEESAEFIRKYHHNPYYLSAVEINMNKVTVCTNINTVFQESENIVIAIPSAFLKNSLADLIPDLTGKYIISAVKGIVPEENLTTTEYFNKHYNVPFNSVGIITGPCHAEEIALERLSYLTIASKSSKQANDIAEMLNCRYVKAITSNDVYGTEYSAVLKNIFAIAAGICHGLGYGDNFIAVLISNGIQEIRRFLDKTYKSKRKINSSAYLGDLLVTAYSQFSRNRTFGTMIGKGYSARTALLEMNMVAEGYFAVSCIKEINKKHGVKMPITDAVYNILYEKISPAIEIKILSEKLK